MPTKISEFHTRSLAAWIESIQSVVGPDPSYSTTWQGRADIVRVLSAIMGSNGNHTHLPDGGGLDFESVEPASEAGCLDFSPDKGVVYRAKPGVLTLEWIDSDPRQSFFLLDLEDLDPSGVYPPREPREDDEDRFFYEELVEVTPGGSYYPRRIWDDGLLPNGRDLPDDARLVVRMMGGKLLFVAKGSLWNGSPDTYDGRHARMSSASIRGVIERTVARMK
ncbi:MAG TPA: hypothetical protein VEZ24_09935 [Microvirga sp.]|nr:hypothetical protein [Microvirga sp.]